MEVVGLVASCTALVSLVATVTTKTTKLVHSVRDARKDLSALSGDLSIFSMNILALRHEALDPAFRYSEELKKILDMVLRSGEGILIEINLFLQKMEPSSMQVVVKWALFGEQELQGLRAQLQKHTSMLDLVMGRINAQLGNAIKTDTTEIKQDTTEIKQDTTELTQGMSTLLMGFAALQNHVGLPSINHAPLPPYQLGATSAVTMMIENDNGQVSTTLDKSWTNSNDSAIWLQPQSPQAPQMATISRQPSPQPRRSMLELIKSPPETRMLTLEPQREYLSPEHSPSMNQRQTQPQRRPWSPPVLDKRLMERLWDAISSGSGSAYRLKEVLRAIPSDSTINVFGHARDFNIVRDKLKPISEARYRASFVTVMELAAYIANEEAIQILHDEGATCHSKDVTAGPVWFGSPLLAWANGSTLRKQTPDAVLQTLKLLLGSGADPNATSCYGTGPLLKLISVVSTANSVHGTLPDWIMQAIDLLIEAGSKPNPRSTIQSSNNTTECSGLLMPCACLNSRPQFRRHIVKKLLSIGTNVNSQCPRHGTVIIMVMGTNRQTCDVDMMWSLLQQGANINAVVRNVDNSRWTALDVARGKESRFRIGPPQNTAEADFWYNIGRQLKKRGAVKASKIK